MKKERDDLDEKYAKAENEKKNLEERFDVITKEIKGHAEAINVILSDKLKDLQTRLDSKEVQLQ